MDLDTLRLHAGRLATHGHVTAADDIALAIARIAELEERLAVAIAELGCATEEEFVRSFLLDVSDKARGEEE